MRALTIGIISLTGAFWPALHSFPLPAAGGQEALVFNDEKAASAIKEKFIALTDGWAAEAVLKQSEEQAMARGRQWEALMMNGLDDPLAVKILAAGEPSYAALTSAYPGKVLDRTVLGSYSDPKTPLRGSNDEFAIWWNGAVSAHLVPGYVRGQMRMIAYNTNLVFRVGSSAETYGKYGERYSRIGYQDGYLPIVRASYTHDGVRYDETVVADRSDVEPRVEDVAYIRFAATNESDEPRAAQVHADLILMDGTAVRTKGQSLLNRAGALVLAHSDGRAKFDAEKQRLSCRYELQPGETAALYLKMPYLPDPAAAAPSIDRARFDSALERVRGFWTKLLSTGMKIEVPEERVNNVWRALLLQNFILADGPRFTYGAGLWYNSSYFPVEDGLAGNDLACYGFGDYSHALLPFCMQVSLYPEQAGRKYQNRRGLALHHFYENYRLTKKTAAFHEYKEDMFRVADEIIADRRSTMVEENGKRPLHWGLLPKDRPGADDLGGKYTMYVPSHNITSCQGLQDLGRFLTVSGLDAVRGERYLREAREYRKTVLDALRNSAIHSPGRPPFVPLQTLYFKDTPDYGPEPFDNLARGRVWGTYYHFWADMELDYNFFNPQEQVARWITDYLEKMGGFVLGCTWARTRPGQDYGWINNNYNSGYYIFMLRRGEVERFLLGFYARLAFAMTRHVYSASEGTPFVGYNTKLGGFTGADYAYPNSAANSETLRMLRSMLVLEELRDNIETGDIFLARGAPRPWFENGKKIEVSNAPTYFGELSYAIESKSGAGLIHARIQPPARDKYRSIIVWLRHPEKAPLRRVRVNGRNHEDFDTGAGWIRLPYGPKEFAVEAFYR